jgi:hypothetical protein
MKLADKTADVMDPAAAKAKAALKSSPIAKPGQSGKAAAMPVAIMASLDLLHKIKGRISEAIDSAGGPAKKEPTEVTAAVTPLRYQAATVIAQILGGSRISGHMAQFKQSMSSPEQMIDVALRIFLRNSHTPEAWADAGRMLELAKSMKIAWNDKVLSQRHREIMDLV